MCVTRVVAGTMFRKAHEFHTAVGYEPADEERRRAAQQDADLAAKVLDHIQQMRQVSSQVGARTFRFACLTGVCCDAGRKATTTIHY